MPRLQYTDEGGQSTCSECLAGYYCLPGSFQGDEHECANETVAVPESYYCPAGSSSSSRVPRDFFSTPLGDDFKFTRQSIAKCPKINNCINGIQYAGFLWYEGDCSDAAEFEGADSKAIIEVEEARAMEPVGLGQRILSPYPVEFELTGDGGRAFAMVVDQNTTSAQIYVNMSGGLDFETLNTYRLGLTAYSNGTVLNCTMNIDVLDVNEKPTLVLGTPPERNVSEAAIVNEFLPGAPARSTDPDLKDEHIYSIIASDPPEGMELFGIGGCSGKLYVAATGLDAVTNPQYNLTILVKDDAAESLSDNGTLTIDVVNANDPPYFLETDRIHCMVREGSPENASAYGTNCTGGFPWSDPDIPFGDTVIFTISRKDVDDTFRINPITGELYIKRDDSIDYDTTKKYSLEVTITDVEGLSASLNLIVFVNNVNEAPISEYPLSFVDENSPEGTLVVDAARVITTDPDSTRFRYSLVPNGNVTDGNGTFYFNISSENGAITVGPVRDCAYVLVQ